MIALLSFVPIGEGTSLSRYVARAIEIIRASGLRHEVHAMGTDIEGGFDEIVAVVRRANEALFELGARRVLIRLTLDDRRDKPATLESKRASVG